MRYFFVFLMIFSWMGCQQTTTVEDNCDICKIENVVENGFSRYYSGIEITSKAIYYTHSRFDRDARRDTLAISTADWAELRQLTDVSLLASLADTLACNGCPVDGSSESIQVTADDQVVNVRMDHNEAVPQITQLLEKLREIREEFEADND